MTAGLPRPPARPDTADRELIAVVVSSANRCLYCLVAHGAALREALGDPVQGERIAFDWRRAGLDERRTAIAAYAEKLTLTPQLLGKLTGRLQTGYVYHYAFVMLLGVLGLVSFALWAWG